MGSTRSDGAGSGAGRPDGARGSSLGWRLAAVPSHRRVKWVVLALWIVIFVVLGPLSGKLQSVMSNDASTYLPRDAQSTEVINLSKNFEKVNIAPAIVVYERAGGLTAADRGRITAERTDATKVPGIVGQVSPVTYARDGKAAQFAVPFDADDKKLPDHITDLRGIANDSGGLAAHVGGPAGISSDQFSVFNKIDGPLLYATVLVVILMLLITYRSPFLWLVPLLSAFGGLVVAMSVVYLAAKHAGLTVNGLSYGILLVLTMGAGTDYALLLVARYREELRRHEDKHEAMTIALHRAGPAILASGTTVVLSMLCLLVSVLNSDRGLGPVNAIGVLAAMLAMLTLLPSLLVAVPRGTFWPAVPRYGSVAEIGRTFWGRVARRVGQHPRRIWVVTGVILLVLASGVLSLRSSGLSNEQSFPSKTDSIRAQSALDAHFPGGIGSPATIIGDAGSATALRTAITRTPGVAGTATPERANGLVSIDAILDSAPDSPAAYRTVKDLRAAVATVPGADAKVGGFTATNLDIQTASGHDRDVVIPLVLVVVFVILMLLLRALLAPLLLIATVVLSFGAALGASWLVFDHLAHFAGTDTSYPLYAFIFLVALGIDYNIFMMTRVREEAMRMGTRRGVLRGLAVTGGVITSAGFVLAATFAVLGVLPLVTMIEIGTTVAFGVLLDTLVVRSVLVPALVHDLGDAVWWPSRLVRNARAASTRPADSLETVSGGSPG